MNAKHPKDYSFVVVVSTDNIDFTLPLLLSIHSLARIKGKIYARHFNHFLCGPPQWQVQKGGMQ